MNKKKVFGILLFVVLGLFIYTLANPRDDEADLKKNNPNNQQTSGETNNSPDGTLVNTPVEPINVVNKNQQENNELEEVIDVEKLQIAINNGNIVLDSSKGSNSPKLNSLLKELADEIEIGKEIITSTNKTQDQADDQTAIIEKLINDINNQINNLFDDAKKSVDEQKRDNTKEKIETAKDATLLLPDGDKKTELLNEIKDITAPVITLKEESTKLENNPYFKEVWLALTDNVALKEIEVNGKVFELSNSNYEDFDSISVTRIGKYGENTIILRDLEGNETKYSFILDNVSPIINGVEAGGDYLDPVMPVINEDYLGSVTLNGEEYNNDYIATPGNYTLVVTDKAGNEKEVSFRIAKKVTIAKQLSDELKDKGYRISSSQEAKVEYVKDSYKLTGFVCVNDGKSYGCLPVIWKDSNGNIVSKINNDKNPIPTSYSMYYDEDETFTAYLYPSVIEFRLDEEAVDNRYLLDGKNEALYSYNDTATSRTYYYNEPTKLVSFPKVICDKCTYEVYDSMNNLVSENISDIVTPINADHEINGHEVYTIKVINRFDVTFKDYNGNIISAQRVSNNKDLVTPTISDYTKRDITYTFTGWDKDLSSITEDTEVTATYKVVSVKANIFELLIDDIPVDGKFTGKSSDYSKSLAKVNLKLTKDVLDTITKNKKVTVALGKDNVLSYVEGTLPEAKEGYTYNWYVLKYETGDGWHIDGKQEINTYQVVFKNYDGTVLETQTVNYKESATAPTLADYTKKHIEYKFTYWDKDFSSITEDTEVTATYKVVSVKTNVYELLNGDIPVDGKFTGNLSDYSKSLAKVNLKLTKDVLDTITKNKKVTVALGKDNVLSYVEGTLPASKEGHTYNWYVLKYEPSDGWHIDGKQEINTYQVVFKDYNGTVLETQTINYKGSATAPTNPTRDETSQYKYEFTGWDKDFSSITEDTVVTAMYDAIIRSYEVEFVTNLGTLIEKQTVKYGDDAKLPEFPKLSTKDGIKYTYVSVTDNYKNITENTIVLVTYKVVNIGSIKANLHDDKSHKDNTNLNGNYSTVLANANLEIYEDSDIKLINLMIEASKNHKHEARLDLAFGEINNYVPEETAAKLESLNTRQYKINWNILIYNSSNGKWNLYGEKVFINR